MNHLLQDGMLSLDFHCQTDEYLNSFNILCLIENTCCFNRLEVSA